MEQQRNVSYDREPAGADLYRLLLVAGIALVQLTPGDAGAEALLTSWQTTHAAQYAQVREYTGGVLETTWPSAGQGNQGGGQATPAWSDVQQIRYSANNVYINSNDLASHVMGPWYNDTNKTQLFGRWPTSTNEQFRFPRFPSPASTHTRTGGDMAVLVNGVICFNYSDAFSYSHSQGTEFGPGSPTQGDGIWNRLAWPIEGITFDPAGAHQPGNGTYHTHANPTGLRYQLNDNLTYNAASDSYSENTSNLHHSPIIGWAYDGYPIYGPYGYSTANDAASGVRRMVSGFVLRNGSNGTTNLSSTGRTTLPQWAADAQGRSTTLSSTQYGPAVGTTYALGRYAEDYDHLADHGVTSGYDLDRYNGRTCVTPEFPGGTYAYFISLDSTGKPAFPNMVGGQFYGVASGGHAPTIGESTTTYFLNTGTSSVSAWAKY